jgi:hypothetical protein
MDETSVFQSRRQLLRYCLVGSVAALAGCQGTDDGSPDGDTPTDDGTPGETPTAGSTATDGRTQTDDGTPTATETPKDGNLTERFELAGDGSVSFRTWLVSDNPIVFDDGTELLFQYNDYEVGTSQNWEDMRQQRRNIAGALGTSPDSMTGELLVGGPNDKQGRLLLGRFDRDGIVSFQQDEGRTITGEYRGYTVLDDQIAVGEQAVLITSLYEQYVDTNAGDGTRLGESDESTGIVLDVLPSGVQIAVSRDPSREAVDVTGTSVTEVGSDGTFKRKVRAFVFESENAASVDAALEFVSMADEEPLTTEHHGPVVIIEYVPA